jgi:hypothetical protein
MKLSGDSALSIEGNVEDSQGSPVAGAVVSGIHDQSRTDAPASATSDPLGHFRLDDLAAGFWDLTASLPGSAPAFARATAGATGLRLRLQKGGRLVGHVSDRGTGKPVPAFTVLLDSKEHRSLASIAGTGDYTLSDLAPGPAVVRVVALGHAPSPERRIIIPGPGAPPATADFELTGGGRLIGVIQERGTSRPIPGAHIEAEGVPDLQVIPVRTEGRTDSDGRFELSGLAEQVTGLFAWAPGFHARIISGLRIPESETRGPVTIELSALAPGEDPGVELVGIGAVLEKGDSSLRIVSVVQTGGAAEAGLLAGDEVVEIDGVSVAPLTLNEAIPLIRGPEGSTVAIAIIRTVGGQRVAALVQVPRRLVRR